MKPRLPSDFNTPRGIFLLLMAFISCSFLCFGPVHSQEKKQQQPKSPATPSPEEPVLRLETELVQIDMVVVDKNGKLVRDLKREDFELYEDGQRREISHFAEGSSVKPAKWLSTEKRKPGTEAGPEAVAEVSAGRYIVLAVDDFHLAAENLLFTKRALTKFVTDQMVPGDQVALITTSGSIGLFQQFTNEKSVLERAINRLNVQNRTVTSPMDIPRITDYQAERIDRGDPDALEIAVQEILRLEPQPPTPAGGGGGRNNGGAAGGGVTPRERAAQQAQSKARMIVAQNAHYTKATLGTLENVIRSLRSLPGRKLMVLVSDGFFLGGNSSSQTYDIRRITDAATRSGLVIYGIDARGLVATPLGGDAADPGFFDVTTAGARARVELSAIDAKRDGMNALAVDTGGKLFFNSNDLNAGLQRVLDDNEVYYVLAFEPVVSRRDGRFHQLEVRVSDRPQLKVRTRKGYLAALDEKIEKPAAKQKPKSPEKLAQEAKAVKEKEIRRGLGSLFPLRDLPIDLTADFADFAEAGASAMVNAHIDVRPLNFQPGEGGTHRAQLDLMVVLFNEQGKVETSYGDSVSLNIKEANLERVRNSGVGYRKVLPLKPGFYQARIAVREAGGGQVGSASKWVEIPDLNKKQLTLSSVFLTPALSEKNVKSETAQPGYQMEAISVTRKFKRDSELDFLIFAYNAQRDKKPPDLVIQPQVYAGSKLVLATPVAKISLPENIDQQRIPYAARLSLDAFTPGEYELKLVVIDRTTKTTTSRRVNFTIE
jgi:VWFA-related protein